MEDRDTCLQKYDLQHVKTGTLRVGVTYSLSSVLTEGVLEFMKLYPAIKLEICYKTVNELLQLLQERKLDFILSYKPLSDVSEVESTPLFENVLSVVVAKDHPLATRNKIKLSELQPYKLVLPSVGLQARMMLDRLMEKKDFKLTSHVELNETNILLQLVAKGGYITVLSTSAVFGKERFRAIALDEPGNVMEASLLSLKGSYQKASAKEFVKILLNTDAVKRRLVNWFE